MKIIDIQHSKTGETRADGRYPLRIGSEVRFYTNLCVGDIMVLQYIKDNQGNAKDGILHTSRIERIDRTKGKIIVTTRNSIYHFETDHPTENGGASNA
jgi:hypothetical protein